MFVFNKPVSSLYWKDFYIVVTSNHNYCNFSLLSYISTDSLPLFSSLLNRNLIPTLHNFNSVTPLRPDPGRDIVNIGSLIGYMGGNPLSKRREYHARCEGSHLTTITSVTLLRETLKTESNPLRPEF